MKHSKQRIKWEKILNAAHHSYERGMQSYAFFKTHNQATGEDLVQDTFIKTWNYLVKGGEVDLMKAFLYHILNQLIIDEYRKHKITSLDTLLTTGFNPSVDDSERHENMLDGSEVVRLVQYLPVKYEKVVRMRYIEGLSLKEISQMTGLSRNAVSVQIHRGMMKLKSLYYNL